MPRLRHAVVLTAAVFACRGDSGPTSPGSSTSSLGTNGTFLSSATDDAAQEDARGPHDSNVRGLVTFTSVNGHFRGCQGVGGAYIENHPNLIGTVTGDPRLTGTIEINAIEVVLFGDDGNIASPSVGPFRIRDASGRIKVEGQYDAWFENDKLQGQLVGHAADAGAALGGLLIANIRYNGFDNGALNFQIGGSNPATELSAGIWAGKCTGKWTDYSGDIPAPPAASALSLRTNNHVPAHWHYIGL